MLAYTKSGGAYVDAWKSAFNHSVKSFVREAVGNRFTVYSKSGWVPESDRRPNTYDDAAIVVGADGRRYLVSIMSTMDPFGDCSPLYDLAAALDVIHEAMRRRCALKPDDRPVSAQVP